MKDNGDLEKDVEKENKFGMTVPYTRDFGTKIKLMDMVD